MVYMFTFTFTKQYSFGYFVILHFYIRKYKRYQM